MVINDESRSKSKSKLKKKKKKGTDDDDKDQKLMTEYVVPPDPVIKFGDATDSVSVIMVNSRSLTVSTQWLRGHGAQVQLRESLAEIMTYHMTDPTTIYLLGGGRATSIQTWDYRMYVPNPNRFIHFNVPHKISKYEQQQIECNAGFNPPFNAQNLINSKAQWTLEGNATLLSIDTALKKLALTESEMTEYKRKCPIYPEDERKWREDFWSKNKRESSSFRAMKLMSEFKEEDLQTEDVKMCVIERSSKSVASTPVSVRSAASSSSSAVSSSPENSRVEVKFPSMPNENPSQSPGVSVVGESYDIAPIDFSTAAARASKKRRNDGSEANGTTTQRPRLGPSANDQPSAWGTGRTVVALDETPPPPRPSPPPTELKTFPPPVNFGVFNTELMAAAIAAQKTHGVSVAGTMSDIAAAKRRDMIDRTMQREREMRLERERELERQASESGGFVPMEDDEF
jgi:hypothetical protein